MSSAANWSYTAAATIWRNLGNDKYGDPIGYSAPEVIMVDYIAGLSAKIGSIGTEVVVKNTFFTEYALAREKDYILIGESELADPVEAGADEIRAVTRWGDTLERLADDWALITGV